MLAILIDKVTDEAEKQKGFMRLYEMLDWGLIYELTNVDVTLHTQLANSTN